MLTLDEIKQCWKRQPGDYPTIKRYDQSSFQQVIKSRTKKQIGSAMQYFWGAFALQMIVYGLLLNVIIRFGENINTLLLAAAGIAILVPFTVVLMKKFKRMAVTRPQGDANDSLRQYVVQQHALLDSFFRFKKRYELFLIPVSTAIGVILVFKLFVPGSVAAHPTGALITFLLTLISCTVAIGSENKKNFREPLRQLQEMLKEFEK
jgi:hypothetical protein